MACTELCLSVLAALYLLTGLDTLWCCLSQRTVDCVVACDAFPEVIASMAGVVCKAQHSGQDMTLAMVFQVACMVRIEVEKAQRLMFQVTVGSSDVNTSAALKDLIAQLLARI